MRVVSHHVVILEQHQTVHVPIDEEEEMVNLWLILTLYCFLSFLIHTVTFQARHLAAKFHQKLALNDVKSSLIPLQYQEIEDSFARQMIEKIVYCNISLPSFVSDFSVPTTCLKYMPKEGVRENASLPPLVLIHGFDSSCLEFRRLAPLLGSKYTVYVPDILGWGFNDCSSVKDYSPAAKLEHLKQFILQVVQEPCILVGASLGGGIAINLATEICPNLVAKIVLLDAQGFIDGKGPSKLPRFVAKIGVNVLRSRFIRGYANYVSYSNHSFSTEDAYRIGKLHCYSRTWENASLSFLLSGGFVFSKNIPNVKQETLIIWGEDDQILPIENAYKFQNLLPSNQLNIIPCSGHVPHIEKPHEVMELIDRFLSNSEV